MIASRPERPALILLRFAVAAALLGYLAHAYQGPIGLRTLPLLQAWFDTFDEAFTTVDLRVTRLQGEEIIQRTVTPAHIHVVGGRVVFTGAESRIQNAVGVGLVLQPFVLGLALVFAWPWKRGLELVLRTAIALVLLLVVVLLDVPMVLYGFEWNQELRLLDPERFSPLLQWGDMMNSGGRFALSAVAAGLAIVGASRLSAPHDAIART